MPVVTASSRGQIVIPRDIRRELNIVAGKKLFIKAQSGRILVTPLPDDPVESFCGIFEGRSSLTRALIQSRKEDMARETKKIAG